MAERTILISTAFLVFWSTVLLTAQPLHRRSAGKAQVPNAEINKPVPDVNMLHNQPIEINYSDPDSVLLNDSWEIGEQLIKKGKYGYALNTWETTYNLYNSDIIPDSDPRIGFRYIEIVTELKLQNRYKKASELYYWGLESVSGLKYKKFLSEELERLEPISTHREQNKWQRLLDENRLKELGQAIQGFWELKDPAPSTPVNERLLEHWERLAYVKDRFTRSNSWVYGTDDRAKIYVSYGAPSKIDNGRLNLGPGAKAPFQHNLSKCVLDILYDQARQMQRLTDYEIWIYDNLVPGQADHTIFLFGNDGNTGEFRELRSVGKMLPSTAYRQDSFVLFECPSSPSQGISASLILQIAYYQQLSVYDSFFATTYRYMESEILSSGTPGTNLSMMFRSRNAAKFNQLRSRAPEERSGYTSEFKAIPVVVHQYRLLNKSNEPVLATFVESKPSQSFYIDRMREKKFNTFNASSYRLVYTARAADTGKRITFTDSKKIPLSKRYGDDINKSPVTFFEIPNRAGRLDQVFSVELHNKAKSSTKLSDSVFPENIRGIGRYSTKQPDPLSTDKNQLEVSDFIVGYKDSLNIFKNPFGFRVVPGRHIPRGKEVMVHLEVYHLNSASNKPTHFKIDYQLKSKEGLGLLKKIFGNNKESTGLTLNFETRKSSYRSNIEIDTSDLEAGDYVLSFIITESNTGQKKYKKVPVTIVE